MFKLFVNEDCYKAGEGIEGIVDGADIGRVEF